MASAGKFPSPTPPSIIEVKKPPPATIISGPSGPSGTSGALYNYAGNGNSKTQTKNGNLLGNRLGNEK
ncbi:hypothetical protein JHK82_016940 [Glycine max]|uniref:Uncharacterized protein n=1 Tax=Glycine max TaxID=3847 RepID=K7KYB7_SOYBN|nr:hypothetical protein JHK82_016940 [Glycine max]KAH1128308.1 hypothetical protein GYH30_016738 [Glycine max]KRH56144.1 hypothetical protein GLYMA_06G306400v4 [Glycine max]